MSQTLYAHLIPERIRELREQFGWSQSELARRMDVTRASINAWESGLTSPTTQYIVAMCRLFHVSADYLLGLESQHAITLADYTEEETALVTQLLQYIDSRHP